MSAKKNVQCTALYRLFRNWGYSLMLLGVLAVTASAHADQLTASVDKDSIGLRETLTLTLSIEGAAQRTPDFSALENDFKIFSRQKSTSIKTINGRAESNTDWQLTLAPKHTGKLLIPSFNFGNGVSDAIEITVSQQNQYTQAGSDEPFKISTATDKESVHVQEQILFTVKLVSEVGLSQAQVETPDVKNAIVVQLGQKHYRDKVNGNSRLIIEDSFAIFPQQSGELIIPSLNYKVAGSDLRSLFDRTHNNVSELRTDEKRIQIKPIPAQSSSKTWLPAVQLTLNETWSGSLDRLKIGEPVTRTITINSEALTAGLIVPLAATEVDGLTFYPEQAQIKDYQNSNGVQGTRVETLAIIPNGGGDFNLPAINIDWWNTRTQKMERVSLPEKKLHVIGEPAKAQTPIVAPPTASTAVQAPTAEVNSDLTPLAASNNSPAAWVWVIIGLLILGAAALAIYSLKLKKHLQQLQQDQADRDNALQEKERDIWDALKTTAATRDANALRKAVLNWAQFQWPSEKVNTLDDIAKVAVSEELTAALKALDELLYSNHSSGEWDSSELLKILNEFRKQRKTAKRSPELKNLYAQ